MVALERRVRRRRPADLVIDPCAWNDETLKAGFGGVPAEIRVLTVQKGAFVKQSDLEHALAEQPPDRRLGEFLVERGVLSGPALACALADQHGIDLDWLGEHGTDLETALKPPQPKEPVYRVYTVTFRHGFQERKSLSASVNFLEAADFAMEYVQEHAPEALEIERVDGAEQETVWTYSETRAEAATLARKNLVETFGFDPTKWGSKLYRESR